MHLPGRDYHMIREQKTLPNGFFFGFKMGYSALFSSYWHLH